MNIKTRPFTEGELQALLLHSPEPWRSIFHLAYATGLRISDLLQIPYSIGQSSISIVEKKTGTERRIRITPSIAYDIQTIQNHGPWHVRKYLLPCRDISTYRKAIVRYAAMAKINLDRIAFHSLRKTCATHISENIGIIAANQFLAHKSLTTTMRYIEQDTIVVSDFLEAQTHLIARLS